MSIALSTEFEGFVRDRVASGQYSNEADVIRAAFALLERREQLLAQIDEGTEQLRNGDYTSYGEDERQKCLSDIEVLSRQLQQGDSR